MSACRVLSYLAESAPLVSTNHRAYADAFGYAYRLIDASRGPRGLQVQALHKYQLLLDELTDGEENDIVLLMNDHALVVGHHPIAPLMHGRDELVIRTTDILPQVDVQIWRNTAASRETLSHIIDRCQLGGEPFASESQLFAHLSSHVWYESIEGVCVAMDAGPNIDPAWHRTPTLAVHLGGVNQSPREMGMVPRFRDILALHLEGCGVHASPLFCFTPEHSPERSSYIPNRPIALVTLYTPEIAMYGAVAEQNLRRYCERHGYSLYVHRAIPSEIHLSGTGNWAKPWLLHAYLQHHQWIVWVDADVLVHDQARALDPLLSGRTILLARDIGQWPFNSGIMGFKQTALNAELLQTLMRQISGLSDRSSVYAGNGDQYYFIEAMKSLDMLNASEILSPRIINTPWFLLEPHSFFVHYYGMWPELRALVMQHDERTLCQQ